MLNAKIKYNMTSRETTERNIIVHKLAEKRVAGGEEEEEEEEKQCLRYSGCAK